MVLLMKNIMVWGFAEIINLRLVRLIGCAFSEVHGVTRDVENQNFGDNCRDTGPILFDMSYSLSILESGYGIEMEGYLSCFVVLVRKDTSVG